MKRRSSPIIWLAKLIADKDTKPWVEDMISEYEFVNDNKPAWEIGILNFAMKERFAKINLKSSQSLAFATFTATAILAVILLLPNKDIIFPNKSIGADKTLSETSGEIRTENKSSETVTATEAAKQNANLQAESMINTDTIPAVNAEEENSRRARVQARPRDNIKEPVMAQPAEPMGMLGAVLPAPESPGGAAAATPKIETEQSEASISNENAGKQQPANAGNNPTDSVALDAESITAAKEPGNKQETSLKLLAEPSSNDYNSGSRAASEQITTIATNTSVLELKVAAGTTIQIYNGSSPNKKNLVIDKTTKNEEKYELKLPFVLKTDNSKAVWLDNQNLAEISKRKTVLFIQEKPE